MKRAIYDFLVFGGIFFIGLGVSKGFSGGLVWISLLVGVVYAGGVVLEMDKEEREELNFLL